MSKKGGCGFKTNPSSHPGPDGRQEAVGAKIEAMASFKKSFESLKGTSHSAAKGVTDSAVQAAQDAVQQVADSSKETVNIAAQEASRQSHAAIGKAADKATDAIKEFGQKMESK